MVAAYSKPAMTLKVMVLSRLLRARMTPVCSDSCLALPADRRRPALRQGVYLKNLDMPELIEKARSAVIGHASKLLREDHGLDVSYIVLELPCTFFMLRSLRLAAVALPFCSVYGVVVPWAMLIVLASNSILLNPSGKPAHAQRAWWWRAATCGS